MDPVLIYTDTKRIASEIATLNKVETLYQAVYTAIKSVGVTPTIPEIDELVQHQQKSNTGDFVQAYILNKLTDAAAPYQMNGVTITREAVKGMIAMPDTTAIKTALQPAIYQVFNATIKGARINLLSLVADVISKVDDADDQLTALFTYYTKNDDSAQVATNLQAVCDALNNFDTDNNGFFGKKTPPNQVNVSGGGAGTVIPGLDFIDGQFVVSLPFIRKYEEKGSLFSAL